MNKTSLKTRTCAARSGPMLAASAGLRPRRSKTLVSGSVDIGNILPILSRRGHMICLLPHCGYLSETSRMLVIQRALAARGVAAVVATQGGPHERRIVEAGL